MNLLKTSLLILAGTLMFLSSCTDDDAFEKNEELIVDSFEPLELTDQNTLLRRAKSNSTDGGEGLEIACLTINFPIKLVAEGGEEFTANNEEDFEALLNDSTNAIIDLVYPFDVLTEDGSNITINSAEELAEAFTSCIPDGVWTAEFYPAFVIENVNSCFSIDYSSFTILDFDNNEIAITSQDELIETLAEKDVLFVYPFNILSDEGETVTVNSTEELFDALSTCNDIDFDSLGWAEFEDFNEFGCYDAKFPYQVTTTDETIVTINNHQEICDLMVQGKLVDFVYPLTILDENGEEVQVQNEEALYELINECYNFDDYIDDFENIDTALILLFTIETTGIESPDLKCFEVNYPIDLLDMETGEIITVNNTEEFIVNENFFGKELVLPIVITKISDNENIEISSATQLALEYENCFN